MNEDRAQGAAPEDSGKEVEPDSIGGDRRAYDETRYGAVSVAVLRLLPESNARALAMGFALGTSLDMNGTDKNPGGGKRVSASVISKKRLPDVLEALGNPDPSQWRRYVRDWVRRHIAHRCEPGVVCLFRLPNLPACPSCRAQLNDFDLYPRPGAAQAAWARIRGAGATLPVGRE